MHNKPLVPTRNGEAPLLAAQRGRYASREGRMRVMRVVLGDLCLAIAATLSFGHVWAGSLDDASIEQLTVRADDGDKDARHALCYRFIYGVGVARDYSVAKHWCEIASASGNASSQILLAEIHYHGQGVPVDYKKAFDLFSAAARQGHPHAQFMLATMYGRGQGVPSDEVRAEEWLRRSASSGYEPALELLQKFEASHGGA